MNLSNFIIFCQLLSVNCCTVVQITPITQAGSTSSLTYSSAVSSLSHSSSATSSLSSEHVRSLKLCPTTHQQNVILSGCHTQTSQTLWQPSPLLLSTPRCSQPLLELCKVLSDSARAFSHAPQST
jgi:hypothetical protein